MLQSAMRSVFVADHSKFGRIALARICDLKDADLILTDDGLDEEMLGRMQKLQLEIEMV